MAYFTLLSTSKILINMNKQHVKILIYCDFHVGWKTESIGILEVKSRKPLRLNQKTDLNFQTVPLFLDFYAARRQYQFTIIFPHNLYSSTHLLTYVYLLPNITTY